MENTIDHNFELRSAAYQMPHLPIGIVRQILRVSRCLGSISFTYHVTPAMHSPDTNIPRLLFSTAWSNRTSDDNMRMRKRIEKVHDAIIMEGRPTNYLKIMTQEWRNNSKMAAEIERRVALMGVMDEYIVPVYGPYKIEGCMCFGFDCEVRNVDPNILYELETMAAISHVRIVSSFRNKMNTVRLSKRETEVLQWIALGKSKLDIATITGLKLSTVDSYTRRVYAKFNVSNKIGAVLAAVSTGKIKL